MAGEWKIERLSDLTITTDFVANGSFESLRNNVTYRSEPDYAVLVRLVDHNAGWTGDFVYVDRASYEFLGKSSLAPGDIIIANVGANAGTVFRVPNLSTRMTLGPNAILCRPKDESTLRRNFLYYYLTSSIGQELLHSIRSGSAQPKFNKTDLRRLSVPIPPVSEQRTIGHILGTLDDKIELNRKMNETLEAIARALFKSWFVDFDPVRAKTKGYTTGLPKHIADLFPDSFVESELGKIPKGWEVGSIYQITDVVYGAPFASSQFNIEESGEPLIRIRDLVNESPGIWTPEVHPKGYKVQPGDIIVGMDGEFRAYLWGGSEAWLNQRVCVFIPKAGYSAAFVRNSIINPLAHIEATETATTVIHLGKSDIDRFSVVIPTDKVLAAFNEHCQPWYNRIVAGKQASCTLAALRDTLLPKLLNGGIHVSGAKEKKNG
ncbi:MAG: restriction endonuclease subunit S [Thermodesulfovibrionales bacterium]|nr:restriction endonuclease subunit S [Thermodesulfovibrionales bacterium]